MMDCILDNNVKEAATIHRHLVPLVKALFIQPNPGPVKHALNQVGMQVGAPRLPLLPPDEQAAASIMEVVNKYTIDIKP